MLVNVQGKHPPLEGVKRITPLSAIAIWLAITAALMWPAIVNGGPFWFQLQKSIKTDMMTAEEWEMHMSPPEDLSHLPDNYADWPDEVE